MKPTLSIEARAARDVESALARLGRDRADALLVEPNTLALTHRERIADLALAHRVPTMYGERRFMGANGLMSYGPTLPDHFRSAALLVDKILKGAKPADLPVEQPTKFEFVINLKMAKTLGLAIPQSLLVRADEVLQ